MTPVFYNTKSDSKDSIEDFMDGMEVMAELQEAQQKQMMRFSNGFEFTLEEFEDANDKVIKEIEADPVKYAEENGISVAQAMLVLEMAKDAKESGTFNEAEARAKYGDEIVDVYQGDIQNDIENAREADNNKRLEAKSEHADVDKGVDLTDEQHIAEAQIVDNDFAELGFGELEDNSSTSLAKSVSENETATASIKSDFGQAVEITIADADIPAQEITIEHQNIMTV